MQNLSGAFEADGNLISRCENMFVQIVQFKLKPDTPREVFLDLAEQMVAWLKNTEGFLAYELYEGAQCWSDRIVWTDQHFAQKNLENFLDTAIAKKLICLIEDDIASFFGQEVIAVSSKKNNRRSTTK